MKRILFPTDFSEVATNAFVHALEFAHAVNGEIIVLHSYDLPPIDDQFFPENFNEVYDTMELAHFDLFKEEIPKLRTLMEEHHYDTIKMTHRLMEGNLAVNIKKAVQDDAIDLVIMGTSSAAEWEAVFAGSNSGAVILNLNVPMLCVPAGVKYKKIHTIGFVTHYRTEDCKALQTTMSIASLLDAKVKCLYIKNHTTLVTSEVISTWDNEFKDAPVTFFTIQSDQIKQVTLDFIANHQIDVLSMLTYKSNFFEAMFVPSYAEKTPSDIQIPVLALHA
ncbi:universal stress protein [Flavobacterium sp. UMI-01]|uniref:universal stress protein n=1 Tax=Flavobacterium sp. UMI-01 TaxID=1441053 RepID=UPI001C7E0ED8|nr:universal stress protein [Flavobacterium sp. UMI-01]GIZ07581.1 universal stress protein UspA [Flavobacterium sp. UMI-01]